MVRGTLEVGAAAEARSVLRDKGLVPIELKEAGAGARHKSIISSGGISVSQLCIMTRQFASLMTGQSPLSEALSAVARQSDSVRLRGVVEAVHARVREGASLAAAMEEFPGVFPRIYRKLVDVGEKSGELDRVLERLAEYYEEKERLRSKVLLAAVYPVLVTVFSLAVISGLMVYVVPKITKVFLRTGQELPWLTKALIWLSWFMSGWGIILIITIAVLSLLAWWFVSQNEERLFKAHSFALSTPLAGKMIRDSDSAALAHALAILLEGKTPIISSLKAASEVMTSLPMRRALSHAAEEVSQGSGLAAALDRTGMLPPILTQFIATGERNGRLGQMAALAARQQSRELETRMAAATVVMGPLLIIAMGVAVMLIVLAVLMPIFEMNQLVR